MNLSVRLYAVHKQYNYTCIWHDVGPSVGWSPYTVFSLYRNDLGSEKKLYIGNNSSKHQPIRTKFSTLAQVNVQEILDAIGQERATSQVKSRRVPRSSFIRPQNEMTFCQLPDGRFSLNLAASDLANFVVNEPNGNLPTLNNPCTVDYFCRICASGSHFWYLIDWSFASMIV